uniref:ARAD1D23012p n=1 Tax=Blastobotrys adeninivorans TaxID=409370 RepID=A0A060TAD7_BLAAD
MAVDDGYISDSDPISKSVKVFRLLCLPSDGSDDDTDSVPRRSENSNSIVFPHTRPPANGHEIGLENGHGNGEDHSVNQGDSTLNTSTTDEPVLTTEQLVALQQEAIWSSRRLRPRTQIQMRPYKYDEYVYKHQFRKSGLAPSRFATDKNGRQQKGGGEEEEYQPEEEMSDLDPSQDLAFPDQITPDDLSDDALATSRHSRTPRTRIVSDSDDNSHISDDERTNHPETVYQPSYLTTENIEFANMTRKNDRKRRRKTLDQKKGVALKKMRSRRSPVTATQTAVPASSQTFREESIGADDNNPRNEDNKNSLVDTLQPPSPPPSVSRSASRTITSAAHSPRIHSVIDISSESSDNETYSPLHSNRLGHNQQFNEVIVADRIDPMIQRGSSSARKNGRTKSVKKKASGSRRPMSKAVPTLFRSQKNGTSRSNVRGSGSRARNNNILPYLVSQRPRKEAPGGGAHQIHRKHLGTGSLEKRSASSRHNTRRTKEKQKKGRGKYMFQLPSIVSPQLKQTYTTIIERSAGKYAVNNRETLSMTELDDHNPGTVLDGLQPIPGEMDESELMQLWYPGDLSTEQGATKDLLLSPLSPSTVALLSELINMDPPALNFSLKSLIGKRFLQSLIKNEPLFDVPDLLTLSNGSSITMDPLEPQAYQHLWVCESTIRDYLLSTSQETWDNDLSQLLPVYDIFTFAVLNLQSRSGLTQEQVESWDRLANNILGEVKDCWTRASYSRRANNKQFYTVCLTVMTLALLVHAQCCVAKHQDWEASLEANLTSNIDFTVGLIVGGVGTLARTFMEYSSRQPPVSVESSDQINYLIEMPVLLMAILDWLSKKSGNRSLSFQEALKRRLEFPTAISKDRAAAFERGWAVVCALSWLRKSVYDSLQFAVNTGYWSLAMTMTRPVLLSPSQESWYSIHFKSLLRNVLALIRVCGWPVHVGFVESVYTFFAQRKFHNVESRGIEGFPAFISSNEDFSRIATVEPTDTAFHVFLKTVADNILLLSGDSTKKSQLKSLIGRIRPLGSRILKRDQPLAAQDIEGLSNDYSLYLTLYRYCPKGMKPSIAQFKNRLNIRQSHIMARKISLKAWYVVMTMVSGDDESSDYVEWYHDLVSSSIHECLEVMSEQTERSIKDKNIQVYEDFLKMSFDQLRNVMSDSRFVLKHSSWYKLVDAELFRVLTRPFGENTKLLCLKLLDCYIAASKDISSIYSLDDDSQGNSQPNGFANPVSTTLAQYLDEKALDILYLFLRTLFSESSGHGLREAGVSTWSEVCTFLVRCGRKRWSDFFGISASYSWESLPTGRAHQVQNSFGYLWLSNVMKFVYPEEKGLYIAKFFSAVLNEEMSVYEMRFIQSILELEPVSAWIGVYFDTRDTARLMDFAHRRQFIKAMIERIPKSDLMTFIHLFRMIYQRYHNDKRENDDYEYMMEDILRKITIQHNDVVDSLWVMRYFPGVTDVTLESFTKTLRSGELLTLRMIQVLEKAAHDQSWDGFDKGFVHALIPTSLDPEDCRPNIDKNREYILEKLVPAFLKRAMNDYKARGMTCMLMRAVAKVADELVQSCQSQLLEFAPLLTFMKGFILRVGSQLRDDPMFEMIINSTFSMVTRLVSVPGIDASSIVPADLSELGLRLFLGDLGGYKSGHLALFDRIADSIPDITTPLLESRDGDFSFLMAQMHEPEVRSACLFHILNFATQEMRQNGHSSQIADLITRILSKSEPSVTEWFNESLPLANFNNRTQGTIIDDYPL